ncbi:MAG: hypothetical protein WCP95_10870 [Actinomycetes bacterium]
MSLNAAHVTPEVVLVFDDAGRLDAHVVRWSERVRARMAASRLDRSLAEGRSPDSSVLLAIRARMLMSQRVRRSLATAFEQLSNPWPADERLGHLPIPTRPLTRARRELATLSARLSAGPVSVRGVAQAQLLLGDGAGPLYYPKTQDALRDAARLILDALEPWPA